MPPSLEELGHIVYELANERQLTLPVITDRLIERCKIGIVNQAAKDRIEDELRKYRHTGTDLEKTCRNLLQLFSVFGVNNVFDSSLGLCVNPLYVLWRNNILSED